MTQTGVENGPVASNNDSVNSSFQLNEDTPGEPMMYHYGNTESNDNSLMNYNYLNLDSQLEEKSQEEANQNAINALARKRVVKNDKGYEFLYDPLTGDLKAFNETRDFYNNVQKLENRVDFVEQSILNQRSVDYTNPNEVKRKFVFPSLSNNNLNKEETVEEQTVETGEEATVETGEEATVETGEEATIETGEETPVEMVEMVEEISTEKPGLSDVTIGVIVLVILLVLSLIGFLIFKKVIGVKNLSKLNPINKGSFNIKFN
jgi:hypothetical protein